jgi:hypothetical protein
MSSSAPANATNAMNLPTRRRKRMLSRKKTAAAPAVGAGVAAATGAMLNPNAPITHEIANLKIYHTSVAPANEIKGKVDLTKTILIRGNINPKITGADEGEAEVRDEDGNLYYFSMTYVSDHEFQIEISPGSGLPTNQELKITIYRFSDMPTSGGFEVITMP